jgi:aspartate/methionine/tyrosine aminotransferase
MQDHDYLERSTDIIRRNYAHLRETIAQTPGTRIPIEPAYGFCTIVDVSGTGVTAQEITVGLLNHGIAAIPGDGLGDVGCAHYLRLNYSSPDIACFERFREALPKAIEEALEGRYVDAVDAFFARVGTERGAKIRELLAPRLRAIATRTHAA